MKFKVTKHKVVKIGGKRRFLMCFSYYIADSSGAEPGHHYRQLFLSLQRSRLAGTSRLDSSGRSLPTASSVDKSIFQN